MPWQETSAMTLRLEFVELARGGQANVRELCRRFGISAKTGYKWLHRYQPDDPQSLAERSRRPRSSPARSSPSVEAEVVRLRRQHPQWGGRKISRRLQDLGLEGVAASTVTSILHRHGLIGELASAASTPWQRFEHDTPNALWQIDFKGDFQTLSGRHKALTLLDDHSRFNLSLHVAHDTGMRGVQPLLERAFRRYGLPVRINADNGAPWGTPSATHHGLSQLSVWLIRLGIRMSHSTPYHPQTNGKLERFHRSLNTEVLAGHRYCDAQAVQRAFDAWRSIYNHQRPHEALGMLTPAQRYRMSPLAYPERLAPIEYAPTDTVVRVNAGGYVSFKGHKLLTSAALAGLPVALRADPCADGCYDILFCHQRFMRLDLRRTPPDT